MLFTAQWVLVLFFWLGYGEHFVVQTEAYQGAPECLQASVEARAQHTASDAPIRRMSADCYRLALNSEPTHVKLFFWVHENGRSRVEVTSYESPQRCDADLNALSDWWGTVRWDRKAAAPFVNVWARCDALEIGSRQGDDIPTREEVDRQRERLSRPES